MIFFHISYILDGLCDDLYSSLVDVFMHDKDTLVNEVSNDGNLSFPSFVFLYIETALVYLFVINLPFYFLDLLNYVKKFFTLSGQS